MKDIALAVFVKTPGLSPIKTRLAKDLGEKIALEFYQQALCCLRDTFSELRTLHPDLDIYWAISEAEALNSNVWQDFPGIHQGQGNLGDRMSKIFIELKKNYQGVILIGADSPQQSAENLSLAIKILKAKQNTVGKKFVIGPAFDGGFYLIGTNASLESKFWSGLAYSTECVFSQIEQRARRLGTVELLPKVLDIDTIDDLKELLVFSKHTRPNTENYQKLTEWLAAIL